MYGLHVTLYVYDTHNDMHMRYTVRVRPNACNERNATDAYVTICTKECYGFDAIALTQHLRRCDTSLARVVVITERSTRALHTTVFVYDTHNAMYKRYTR